MNFLINYFTEPELYMFLGIVGTIVVSILVHLYTTLFTIFREYIKLKKSRINERR